MKNNQIDFLIKKYQGKVSELQEIAQKHFENKTIDDFKLGYFNGQISTYKSIVEELQNSF